MTTLTQPEEKKIFSRKRNLWFSLLNKNIVLYMDTHQKTSIVYIKITLYYELMIIVIKRSYLYLISETLSSNMLLRCAIYSDNVHKLHSTICIFQTRVNCISVLSVLKLSVSQIYGIRSYFYYAITIQWRCKVRCNVERKEPFDPRQQ